MADPRGHGSSRISGLNLASSVPSEDVPTVADIPSTGRRSDRIQGLLERILLSFSYNLARLPPEAQKSYTRFRENRNFPEFAAMLKHLLLDGSLDTFMEGTPVFIEAAFELFDSRYPHLGLKKRLDEAPSRAELARTLTLPVRAPTQTPRGVRIFDWARVEARRARPPPAVADSSSAIPTINIEHFDPANDQEDQPTAAQKPVIPGFVISTRTGSGNKNSSKPATGEPESGQSRREKNGTWLEDYLKARGGPRHDFNLYPYKGWKIEPPEVLLHRAINFLADEDIDRTLDWDQKFAELTEYFSYLLSNWQGEEWGAELHEAIDMLHTHWIFEQYHYGVPELNLKFDNVWPKHSKRLPPIPGVEYAVEKPDVSEGDLGERRLLLNKIRPAIDVHYKLPENILKKYASKYASETPDFWGFSYGSGSLRKNLVSIENNAFEKCVFSDMSTTDKNIRMAAAKLKSESGRERPNSHSFKAFATLRGSQRAALQQTLTRLDNSENLAVCNMFRTLILPPPRIPDKRDAGILLSTMQVANVPEKESRDPFSYTLGHMWYIKAERYWKNWTYSHAVKECYSHKKWEGRKQPIMDLPKNYMGPYIVNFLDHEMKKALELLRKCEALQKRISLQYERAPRTFLYNMIRSMDEGLSGRPWNDIDPSLDFKGEDFMPNSQDLAYIRPKEEEFLRLLGESSIHSNMFDPKIKPMEISPRSKIFEQRAMDILYGKSTTTKTEYEFGKFMEELNAECGGPVKRWRFSRDEALDELKLLERKGVVGLNGDQSVSCAKAHINPEDRVRWLDTDDDLDAYIYGVEVSKNKPSEEEAEAGNDRNDVEAISTAVSIPETEDLGNYMFGLPKIENLRSWEECWSDPEDVEKDIPRTQKFYLRLCFRLGNAIKVLRSDMEIYRRQLTPQQRAKNREFVRDTVNLWESDTRVRPNQSKHNPNMPKGHLRVTPEYPNIINMAEPEACNGDFGDQNEVSRVNLDMVRKGIIREAYENKSMLFPSRIDRRINEKGQTVKLPRRREPVWSFAHPERKAKAPRYWDINRWPLHLQSDSTAASIRSGNFHDDAPVRLTTEPVKKSESPVSPVVQREAQREVQPKPQPEPQPQATTTLPNVAERTGTSEHQGQTIPGLGEFTVTFEDLAHSRRTFTPGPARYFLGDTPLQKKAIEDYLKSGIETTEPPSWQSRLGALLGRKETQKDPTALPKVHPRNIPKSKPRSEPEESDDDSFEDMPDAGENDGSDVEMEDARLSRAQAPSPMIPAFPASVARPGPEAAQEQTSTAGLGDPVLAEQTMRQLRLVPHSRELPSRPLELEIEETETSEGDEDDDLYGSA
ncbi:hypothetical protein F53441_7766 [Fusarium austroafricanum]|uniref:Uncharacterized protein n=1 Tax=Fusarium austroafricanum TaxID=2364996 RepID=A0A8H4NX83_9HYPO|nr:hypothetical protein F53441_7766 [Fusarium austroafricanum]